MPCFRQSWELNQCLSKCCYLLVYLCGFKLSCESFKCFLTSRNPRPHTKRKCGLEKKPSDFYDQIIICCNPDLQFLTQCKFSINYCSCSCLWVYDSVTKVINHRLFRTSGVMEAFPPKLCSWYLWSLVALPQHHSSGGPLSRDTKSQPVTPK